MHYIQYSLCFYCESYLLSLRVNLIHSEVFLFFTFLKKKRKSVSYSTDVLRSRNSTLLLNRFFFLSIIVTACFLFLVSSTSLSPCPLFQVPHTSLSFLFSKCFTPVFGASSVERRRTGYTAYLLTDTALTSFAPTTNSRNIWRKTCSMGVCWRSDRE